LVDAPHETLAELRRRYLDELRPMPASVLAALRADPRAGARSLLNAIERRRTAGRTETERLRRLRRFEQELWSTGVLHVAGVDEAGMSPLAGPVVAGAVILPVGYRRAGIDDSKRLSPAQREQLAEHIKREAVAWGVGRAEPEEIDRINIYHAGLLAMRRAVEALQVAPDYLLVDARTLRDLPVPQRGIIRGDTLSISIAAASILAKTTRDAVMVEFDRLYPGYGLAQHKGYPVASHVDALQRLGVSAIHRRSFGPVKQALGIVPEQRRLF